MIEKIASVDPGNNHSDCVEEASVLTSRERHRILYEWNDTSTGFPDACVHELFEQQVARDPGAVAIVSEGRQMSYEELNARANQVARSLRKRGVGPEVMVGVCLKRSPEMVVALLGVWKAGGAYVPLDPSYPPERLAFMVRDTAMRVFLTEEKCKNLCSSAEGISICMDSEWSLISRESITNLAKLAVPSNLAYVIYTSGSTGQPKGAMIQHTGLANYLCWAIKAYAVEGRGSVPVHASIAFDSTVASLYPPLLSGGQIELLPEDIGAQSLLAALRKVKNRSKVVITPAHLELLNQQLSPEEMNSMTKTLVIAGEALLAENLSKWREFAPSTRLFNEYGPTETTVGCCAYEVRADDPRSGPVPIGRPIDNVEMFVLDPNLQPVPPGVIGEVHIGGVGVGRGYLNRTELTREKFLDDPFSNRSRARLYKTGDLARHRKDGTLEFLGRVDGQVKVRGRRIELGEIEATVVSHPAVRSCAVLVRENAAGNRQLVCYLVVRKRESLVAEELRKFLRKKLPEYMVPAHFVLLDSLPLTQNGKIDRLALQGKSFEPMLPVQERIAPRTETEKKLAAIWMELLNVDEIGVEDNFYDLGGDSLLAVRAMLQVREVFGVFPNMQDFFPSATIAGLAKVLTQGEGHEDRLAYAVPVQPEGNEPPLFWIGAGLRSQQLSAHLGPNQPFIGIGIEPKMIGQLKAPYRLEELAGHLVTAIRSKRPHGPYRLGGFCQEALIAYEAARQLTTLGETVELLALLEPEYPRQSMRARIATKVRRKMIRANFHLENLKRLGANTFPRRVRVQWVYLKDVVTQSLGRSFESFLLLKSQLGPRDFGKINTVSVTSYKPTPLGCPTAIFRCKDWPFMSAGDPYFGWRELLTGGSEIYEVPGDHEGIFHEPNVKILAEQLRACLRNTRRTQKSSYEVTFDGA
ncbi:MAG TPA: amino acid adenylation domain-containing protein [Verrucomicrobiae bacterium]|nr:amino acid adenylation domain-containing protein [Verrucomicrobiae bacterium]